MSDRFEFVLKQDIFDAKKDYPGTPYEKERRLLTAIVLRDKQTGVMYLWGEDGNKAGLSPLIDKDGKPVTTYKVSI